MFKGVDKMIFFIREVHTVHIVYRQQSIEYIVFVYSMINDVQTSIFYTFFFVDTSRRRLKTSI